MASGLIATSLVASGLIASGVVALTALADIVVPATLPLVDAGAFHADDFVELAADVVHHAREVELRQPLLLAVAQGLEHLSHALQAVAAGDVHAAGEEVAHGPAQIAVLHEVVHHRAQGIVGGVGQHLAAVPLREAVASDESAHGSFPFSPAGLG